MEGMGHIQHRSRSSLADNPRCPAQDRRSDRSKPFTLHALTRTRMRLLCYDPCDSFAYSLSAAGSRCKEPFDAETNPHERANTTCRPRQAGSTRTGLRRLAAIGRRGLHREAPRRTYNRPRAGSFRLFEFTGAFPVHSSGHLDSRPIVISFRNGSSEPKHCSRARRVRQLKSLLRLGSAKRVHCQQGSEK
jgi:hypothetical protein